MSVAAIFVTLAVPGWAQNLQGSDSLIFPAHQLTGAPAEISATSAPAYQIEWLGNFPSFEITLVVSSLTSQTGRTMPADLLSFTSQGASFVTLEGDLLEAVQVETLASGPLTTPLLVLTAPAGIQGRWRYLPRASNFRLQIPAETYSGVYSGQITATITGGP